jgi:type II secretory pathway pseudopilin PulG
MKISNNKGDTLIEVVIAITIVGTILASALSLSSRAIRLGIAARERSQASQLLQQQAEGLRSLRDSMDWSQFTSTVPLGSVFHVEKFQPSPGVYRWRIASGVYAPVIDGQPTIFSIYMTASFPVLPPPGNQNRRDFVIIANWERIGGGTDQSTLYTHLANRSFTLSYIEPNILMYMPRRYSSEVHFALEGVIA